MKNISVVFSKHKGFNVFSSLIMFGLKTPFSHVAIRMVDGDTAQTVYYQASGLAVNVVSEQQFMSTEQIIKTVDFSVSDKVFVSGKTFAINQLGKPYSVLAILGFALQILLGMAHIRISNPFKANGASWVCSQLGAGYIDAADNVNLDVSEMTPLALYDAVQKLPNTWI
jgi:hypothetical protein